MESFDTTDVEVVDEALVETEGSSAGDLSVIDFNKIDFGMGDVAGVVVVDTGTKVSRFPIERLKFTTAKKERISIITDKVVVIKTHYTDEVGSIICNGEYCCERFGLPNVRYVFPVVYYEGTDKKGTPLTSDIEVRALAVGKDSYEELCTILDNKGSLSQFDIVVTCTDEGYQKCSFTEAGEAKWKKSKKCVDYVINKMKKDGKNLVSSMGRVVTTPQLKKLLGEDIAPGEIESVNMDDIFGDNE